MDKRPQYVFDQRSWNTTDLTDWHLRRIAALTQVTHLWEPILIDVSISSMGLDVDWPIEKVRYLVQAYGIRFRHDRLRKRGYVTCKELSERLGIHEFTLQA